METHITREKNQSRITLRCTVAELEAMERNGAMIYAHPAVEGEGIAACYIARQAAQVGDVPLAGPEAFFGAQASAVGNTRTLRCVESHARIVREMEAWIFADLCTPQGFQAWLEGHGAQAPVGLSQHSALCPLAQYLSRNGAKVVVYGVPARVYWNEHTPGEGSLALPPWAKKFVEGIDTYAPEQEISREEALRVLGQE